MSVSHNIGLHYALRNGRREVFDNILSNRKVKLNALNTRGRTPLHEALLLTDEYFALKLIEKGASVTTKANNRTSVLHFAKNSSVTVVRKLIEKGAPVNALNAKRKTPLHVVCERGNEELIHVLLYYGANPTIVARDGSLPLTAVISRGMEALSEIFFNYTFHEGEKVPVGLDMLRVAMVSNSPLFFRILDHVSEVVYEDVQLQRMASHLALFNMEKFEIFVSRYENITREMFQNFDCLKFGAICRRFTFENLEKFCYMLARNNLMRDLLASCKSHYKIVHHLVYKLTPNEEGLTNLLCYLLGHGMRLTFFDLHQVYFKYKYNLVFPALLQMDVDMTDYKFREINFPALIYYDVDFDSACLPLHCIKDNPLLRLFFQSDEKSAAALRQLSTEAARKAIIQKYNIRTCAQFYTVLNWLPINNAYKKILAFRDPTYC